MMRFAFFGTRSIALPVLEALERHHYTPSLIVTAPDKKAGRGMMITSPPTKEWAKERGIEVFQPITLRDDTAYTFLAARMPFDFFVVASYGKIIPSSLLSLPSRGTLNVHPSLLPALRGPSPIQAALLSEHTTGVSIMVMDEEVDHGPVLVRNEIQFPEWPLPYPEVEKKLGEEGGELLAKILPLYLDKTIDPIPQDHESATYTKKILKEDGFIHLQGNPESLYRKYCAYKPWPGVYFIGHHSKTGESVRVKITEARFENQQFIIEKVIPENRKEMSWEEFERGFGPQH